jgi:hypothetical protein
MTSDIFFENNKELFDIIFIDGLHIEQQVDKDIYNCLRFLLPKGYIVMHDCNPPTEFHQRESYEVNGKYPPWNGTVWKSFAKLRINNSNLDLCCVDCDWGVGIIKQKHTSNFILKKILNFDLLNENRKELLNLMSVNKFINKH